MYLRELARRYAYAQNIAKENNFSETAFAVKKNGKYHLRWFTPNGEIDFCGHATLGTAYVIKRFYQPNCNEIVFFTLHGDLTVTIENGMLNMIAPAYPLKEIPVTLDMINAIGAKPNSAYLARDLLLVLSSQKEVEDIQVVPQLLKGLDGLCVIVTAKGEKYDCVSRVFAPELEIIEDPVTGSAHCMIVPYWAKVLNKNKLIAYQASSRGGVIYAGVEGDTVTVSGKAVLYSISDILTDHIF